MANNQNNLVAVFDDYETAHKAQDELLRNGFSNNEAQIVANDAPRTQTAASGSGQTVESQSGSGNEGGISGFFHRLFGGGDNAEMNDESGNYSEAVRRGSAVLTVTADDSRLGQASDILNRYHPIDIDHRTGFYKETGYSKYDPNVPAYTAEEATRERETFRSKYKEGAPVGLQESGDRTIPVVQEEVQVGKRSVQRGGVRVYTQTITTPVEQDVKLREEHVTVERHAVNRPATEADFNRRNEVIEMVETAEEAVVGKTSRVVEEVVVGKQSSERTETIRDSVRRTDVQVENLTPEMDADFRNDFKSRYANETGAEYNAYSPAYEYGYRTSSEPSYSGKSWNDVEEKVKTDYMRNNPGSSWDRAKGAVRYGWERTTGKR